MGKYRFDKIAVNSTEKKKPEKADKHTYIGLEHLDPGRLQVTRYGSDVAPIGEKLIMRKGDVLFGKRRAYQKKVAIAPFDGIFSAHGMVLRPNEEVIDRDFFPFFISSDYFLDAAIAISVGSLSPTINWRDLKELEFKLPSLDKQRELAKIFWAMEETKNSYQILLQKTGELIKSQYIKMFGDPGSIDNRWKNTPICELFEMVSRGKQPEYVGESNTLTINQACIYWDKIVFENVKYHNPESKKRTLPLKNEDILINSTGTGTLGRCNIFRYENCDLNYVADSHVTVLRSSPEIIPDFFKCFMQFDDSQKRLYAECVSGSTNQIELSKEKLLKFVLPVPPIDLQIQFADFQKQADKSKLKFEQSFVDLTRLQKRINSGNFG